MKKYKRAEFDRIMRNNGFIKVRQSGGHTIYERNGIHESVPLNLEEPIALRLIKTHHLDVRKKRCVAYGV